MDYASILIEIIYYIGPMVKTPLALYTVRLPERVGLNKANQQQELLSTLGCSMLISTVSGWVDSSLADVSMSGKLDAIFLNNCLTLWLALVDVSMQNFPFIDLRYASHSSMVTCLLLLRSDLLPTTV